MALEADEEFGLGFIIVHTVSWWNSASAKTHLMKSYSHHDSSLIQSVICLPCKFPSHAQKTKLRINPSSFLSSDRFITSTC